MSVRDYDGLARPMNEDWEGRDGYRVVEWDDPDGSIYRGYELPDGRLIGACIEVSPAREAELEADRGAAAAAQTSKEQFIQACRDLFLKARAHAQAPGANPSLSTREMNEAIARLFRLAQDAYNTD